MDRKPRRHRGVLPRQSNEGTRGDPGVVQADGRSVPSWGGMLLTLSLRCVCPRWQLSCTDHPAAAGVFSYSILSIVPKG